MNKKILFLSPFFYPEQISTGKYNSFLVEKLLDKNFDVDVVAFYPFYPEWKVKMADTPFRTANVYRFGDKIRFPRSQILRRIILEISFTFYTIKFLKKRKNKYDIVISIFPPVLFMLITVFFFRKSSKVGIVHDIQGIMANTEKSYSRRFSASIMGYIEKLVYKRCDKLICLSNSMRQVVIDEFGVSKEKCNVFYPFVSIPNFFSAAKTEGLEAVFTKGFKHIVYSGALGEKQQPVQLYDFFLKLSRSASNIKCHIFSRGPFFNELIERSGMGDCENIHFHDLVPEEDLDALFLRSTIQIIPQSSGTGAGAFPSKLPNLLAHGVPVFAICDRGSELDVVLSKVNSAKVVYTWEAELMVNELHHFLKRVDGLSHEKIFLENRETILKEFDVDRFIKSLDI